MKLNVGTIERIVRVVIGIVLVSMVFIGPKSPWFYLGLIPLATGLAGWCPIYSAIHFNTHDKGAGAH